jgi:hypothetical protein
VGERLPGRCCRYVQIGGVDILWLPKFLENFKQQSYTIN